MLFRVAILAVSLSVYPFGDDADARSGSTLTLRDALHRALASNPRLTAAERDVGIATGRRIQSGAIANPELSVDVDNVAGSGAYRGGRSVETLLQISQLIELPSKRAARIGAASAGLDSAAWQRQVTRLEILSETAIAYFSVLGAQRRIEIFDEHVATLDRLTPLLQRRVDAGAASIAEIARGQVAADLIRADRERAKAQLSNARRDLAILMGTSTPQFARVAGRLAVTGSPPSFKSVLQAIDANPQLIRWSAVRVQREQELIASRLKAVPDARVGVGWKHERATGDNAVRVGLSVALPVWDQNRGDIFAAEQNLEKAHAEQAINKALLISTAGRAYDTVTGALREIALLRDSAIPNARRAAEAIESGYTQGRFTLLELLDAVSSVAQASLREQEAQQQFHVGIATIEGLVGDPFVLSRAGRR
ncbi:divalent cation transporter [Afipia sp. P52-10]|uniref:TolC family protein n=1 Tax=Afipia sp. P52-10 TaxID=1429916 RepID=UPI0003DF2F95|nr:TolC family protein [Afipia sp. P52-10]ETR76203.1 divalent cation transporter [Afipia sp. P52-10]